MAVIELMRMGERLLVCCGGILCVYLGYKLFSIVPYEKTGNGTFKFPSVGEITLTRIAPGVFFALFGAAVLSISLMQGIYVGPTPAAVATVSGDPASALSSASFATLSKAGQLSTLKQILKESVPADKQSDVFKRLDLLAQPDPMGFYGYQAAPTKPGEIKG